MTEPNLVLRRGATGDAVRELQEQLNRNGAGIRADGVFGPETEGAVRGYQRDHRPLEVDGIAGPQTIGSLVGRAPVDAPARTEGPRSGAGAGEVPTDRVVHAARGTGYYPDSSPLEGGYVDRKGKPLNTLQDYLAGRAPYVSVAMDLPPPRGRGYEYGTQIRIPELERAYGRDIDFRVVDTGGAFYGKGKSRVDICTEDRAASLSPLINRALTIYPR